MARSLALTLLFTLCTLAADASDREVHGVTFADSPGAAWRCGLSNDDLPGLTAERMLQPVAAACESGSAKAYVVIVDLSDSRSVMRAEQMAADAEEQLPPSWKIESKTYDVITLANGRGAAYSRLVGKGNGFTFLSGQTSMVAISANVPMLFEDAAGAPRQAIAVFRVRAPLPTAAAQRKETIADLDRLLRAWAGTARPASGRALSDRDFELSAYARTRNAAPASERTPRAASGNDRVLSAVQAAMNGRATADDLAALEDASTRFPNAAMGDLARSLIEAARRAAQQNEQEALLASMLDHSKDHATALFSRFVISALRTSDTNGLAAALRIAKQRGWTLRDADTMTIAALRSAIVSRTFTPSSDDRDFFELSTAELLPLAAAVPIETVAKFERGQWRLKNRREAPKAAYVVQHDKSVGVLEQQGAATYRLRVITNLLDLP